MWFCSDPVNLHGGEKHLQIQACFFLKSSVFCLQEKTEWVREVFGDDGDWELHSANMTNLPVAILKTDETRSVSICFKSCILIVSFAEMLRQTFFSACQIEIDSLVGTDQPT